MHNDSAGDDESGLSAEKGAQGGFPARHGDSGRAAASRASAVPAGVSIAELVAALEHLDVAVMVRRLDGAVVMANSAFARMLGYSRGELAGVNARVFLTPDRARMVEESSNWLRDGQQRGFSGNGRMMAKDNSVLRIRINVTTVMHGGQMLVVSIIEDWSEILWSDPKTH